MGEIFLMEFNLSYSKPYVHEKNRARELIKVRFVCDFTHLIFYYVVFKRGAVVAFPRKIFNFSFLVFYSRTNQALWKVKS